MPTNKHASETIPNFTPPPRPYKSALVSTLSKWFPPTVQGLEHLRPETPSLFVGNHTTYGLVDIPLFQAAVYNHSGIFLRGLSDHLHYKIPAWARYLESNGAIRGTPSLCNAAMEQGENILVFPGGGREVMKRKGEQYQLIWKQRLGFVKLAAKHGYPIQPFASVGVDDAWNILWDAGNWQRSRLQPLLSRTRLWDTTKQGEEIPPLVRGMGLSVLPRPEPFYFPIGPAIETTSFQGLENDPEAMMSLRQQVENAVNALILEGKSMQAAAPKAAAWRRLLNRI